jgi:hypothetical protein
MEEIRAGVTIRTERDSFGRIAESAAQYEKPTQMGSQQICLQEGTLAGVKKPQ